MAVVEECICVTFQNHHGKRWFQAQAIFLQSKNSRPTVYMDVYLVRPWMNGGIKQKQVWQNAKLVAKECKGMYSQRQP